MLPILRTSFPIAALLAGLGMTNYLYTYFAQGRFTNMSATLMMTAVTVFLTRLVSERITNLMYQTSN